jgi:hypothetical protein
MKRFTFDDQAAFLAKLDELLAAGVPATRIETVTPIPVHEALHRLKTPASPLRYFTFTGAFAGTAAGLALTLYASQSWPLITGGKPIVSLPAYLIIVFELTILLGALASLIGFLFLSRLPAPRQVVAPDETGNQYVILVAEDAP